MWRVKSKSISILSIVSLCVFSCKSVQRHNEQLVKYHSKADLQKDIDFAYAKLKRLHPRLFDYSSEKRLDSVFHVLKESLQDSANLMEFYWQLAPAISMIHQGHIVVAYHRKDIQGVW